MPVLGPGGEKPREGVHDDQGLVSGRTDLSGVLPFVVGRIVVDAFLDLGAVESQVFADDVENVAVRRRRPGLRVLDFVARGHRGLSNRMTTGDVGVVQEDRRPVRVDLDLGVRLAPADLVRRGRQEQSVSERFGEAKQGDFWFP